MEQLLIIIMMLFKLNLKNQKKEDQFIKFIHLKKRAINQGRSLAFIHKYYDENFIIEEDNENGRDNENKK